MILFVRIDIPHIDPQAKTTVKAVFAHTGIFILMKTNSRCKRAVNKPIWNNIPAVYVGRCRYADSFFSGDIAFRNMFNIPYD